MFTVKASSRCSGYELLNSVLRRHIENGIDILIHLASRRESEWLEFKAAMVSRPGDRKKNEKPVISF